ncbi:MAG: tripartite tricarboxylate transporter permease [Nanoarchaeota archaeon]|nr:tripartite tricarboxylate transporter permease [Nanoarchaeota archaeon]
MLLNLIIALFLGIIVGAVVGFLPGLHPNTVAAVIIASDYNIENSVFLFACLISSNVFEFLSTCYLGVPEEGESLTRMPLHNLLMDKRGLAGMKIVAYSSIITYCVFLIFGALLHQEISLIYSFVKNYAWTIMAGIALHLIIKDKSIRLAALFFTLSGILGVITFNLNLKDPFLPLLTGFFGISSLIDLKNENNNIPKQMNKVVVESSFSELLKASIIGIISSIIMAIVPSMSPSQVGLVSEEFKKTKTSDELKIASMTSINIADNILSLIALTAINKARSGVIEKIGGLIELSFNNYYLLLITGFFACTASCFLLIKTAKRVSKHVYIFNNKLTKLSVIIFVASLCLYFNGLPGLLILFTASIIGYYCIRLNVRRSQLLGCLVVPTIIFYLSII